VIDNALAYSQVRWGMHLSGRSRGIALAAATSLLLYGAGLLAVRAIWGSTAITLLIGTIVASALYVSFAWRHRTALDLPLLLGAILRRPTTSTR
jgi:hypothetical protein